MRLVTKYLYQLPGKEMNRKGAKFTSDQNHFGQSSLDKTEKLKRELAMTDDGIT